MPLPGHNFKLGNGLHMIISYATAYKHNQRKITVTSVIEIICVNAGWASMGLLSHKVPAYLKG